MTKEVWLIRHAESTANAGAVAGDDPAVSPLTEYGHAQAKALASVFDRAPDLFVVSPYLRTHETAAPAMARFPDVPVEIWPVQELTYLAPARCVGLNTAGRRPMVEEYWQRCDPLWIDGEGAKSFSKVLERVRTLAERIAALSLPLIAIFTHGLFMRAWQLVKMHPNETDAALMARFWAFAHTTSVRNGEILRIDSIT